MVRFQKAISIQVDCSSLNVRTEAPFALSIAKFPLRALLINYFRNRSEKQLNKEGKSTTKQC